ncbi:MAG TPA: hypothetical protein VN158_03460, partial [Caulobacter sp.]|nr:hypothetical protein [Caulobacter sp.]
MRLLSSALRRGLLAAVMLATGSSALAQSATDLTSYYLWDKDRRLIMKIGQDPDGPTLRPNNQPSALRRAEKFTYDDDGLLMQTEVGTVASVSIDAAGVVTASGFQASAKTQFKYDAIGNRTQVYTNGGASAATLTETSYDAVDRPVCTAVRMTPTSFAALYAAAG